MSANPNASYNRHLFLLISVSSLVLFWNLNLSPLAVTEAKWAVIAREMIHQGNYLVPTINGEPYFDKPVPSYWLVAVAAGLRDSVPPWSARLPSALAALGVIGVTVRLGKRMGGWRAGLWAGWVLLATPYFFHWARYASADMLTVFGCGLTLLIATEGWERDDARWIVWASLAAAITSLMKGLLGIVLPLWVLVIFSALEGKWFWWWKKETVIGLLIFLGVYASPFALTVVHTRSYEVLDLVYRENILRFFKPFDHAGKPWFYYVVHLFTTFAPWCLLLPLATADMFRATSPEGKRVARFLSAWVVGVVGFFSLAGSKRVYYILPVLQPCALIVSLGIVRWLTYFDPPDARRLLRVPVVLIGIAVILAGFLIIPAQRYYSYIPFPSGWRIVVASLIVIGALILWTAVRGRLRPALLLCMGALIAAEVYAVTVVLPAVQPIDTLRAFIEKTRKISAQEQRVPVFADYNPAVIYDWGNSIGTVLLRRDPAKKRDYPSLLVVKSRHYERLKSVLSNYEVIVREEDYGLPTEDPDEKYLLLDRVRGTGAKATPGS